MPTTPSIPSNPSNEISLTFHPPERDRRFRRQPAQAGGCCSCCCCCCLHSIGGLLGAVVGASLFAKEDPQYRQIEENVPGHWSGETRASLDESEDPHPQYRYAYSSKGKSPSGDAIFWSIVLTLFVGVCVSGGEGWLIAILALPVMEFVAVLIALGIIGGVGGPDMGEQMRRLGGIALGAFLGTGFGILLMLPFYLANN